MSVCLPTYGCHSQSSLGHSTYTAQQQGETPFAQIIDGHTNQCTASVRTLCSGTVVPMTMMTYSILLIVIPSSHPFPLSLIDQICHFQSWKRLICRPAKEMCIFGVTLFHKSLSFNNTVVLCLFYGIGHSKKVSHRNEGSN